MNDLSTTEDPPNPLSVRRRGNGASAEWFVYSSFAEKALSKTFSTEEAAEVALSALSVHGRGKR